MKRWLHHRGIWILAAALSLSLTAAALHVFFGGRAGPVQTLFFHLSRPVQAAAAFVDQNVTHLYGQAKNYDTLLAENTRLLDELAALREEARAGAAALRENARLRELLDLRQARRELSFASAKILSYRVTGWSSAITIAAGATQAVAPQDCVVDSRGALLGIVTQVGDSWSEVMLISDPGFSLGGEVAGERGILEGDFSLMSEGKLKLNYLPRDSGVAAGDEVVTFATEGVYPSGLLVGVVEEVLPDPSGMHACAIIAPAGGPRAAYQAFVITDFAIED